MNDIIPNQNTALQKPLSKPSASISKGTHFGLSLLAVIIGVPLSFIITMIISFFVFMMMFVALAGLAGSNPNSGSHLTANRHFKFGNSLSTNKLISITINGPIVSQSTATDPLQTIFGQQFTDGEKVKEQLIELGNDPDIKGIILEIDSPGGQINSSKAISDGVKYVRNKNKPIIAHINGSGASGAYWVASSTDYIIAEQGSLVGNIGVIFGDVPYFRDITEIAEVTSKTSIPIRSFSAGKSKDIGNPFRDMTPAEVTFVNETLAREYEQFVNHVSQEREIDVSTLKQTIGAYPYDTQKAQELRLIDRSDRKEEAYVELSKRANLPEKDFVVEQISGSKNFFDQLFGAFGSWHGLKVSHQQPNVDVAARQRFCTQLTTKPLALYGSVRQFCD